MNHMTPTMRKADNDTPVSTVLAVIESVMNRAEQITKNAAAEHLDAFKQQMREKLGVDDMALNEPYLPALLKQYEVRFLESLEKLFDRIDKRTPEESAKSSVLSAPWLFEYKALHFDKPLLPQIEERLDMEAVRYTRHLKQGLDGARQQAAGIVKYIWRTAGDDRVRPSHALNEGKIFTWGDDEDPGEAFGCRCSAEPILEDAGLPELQAGLGGLIKLLPKLAQRAKDILGRAGKRRAERAAEEAAKPKPTPPKPAEAPKPPAKPKPDISKRPEGVPKDWKATPTKNGDGVVYTNPKDPGTYVKVQKGNPSSSQPGQRYDNVRVQKSGQSYDVNGNKVPQKSEEAHIPLEDFKFPEGLFK